MFNKLIIWSNLTPTKKLNFLVGVVIVALSSVVIHYENKTMALNEEHTNTVNRNFTRYSAREAALQAKIEICNQNYFLYLQENEKEYKQLFLEAKSIKAKTNENDI